MKMIKFGQLFLFGAVLAVTLSLPAIASAQKASDGHAPAVHKTDEHKTDGHGKTDKADAHKDDMKKKDAGHGEMKDTKKH